MAFTVHFSGRTEPQEFGDEDGFEFLDGGVLAIHFGDEESWAQYHPPTKWEQVSADPDHLAGLNTPYVEEAQEDDEYEDWDDDFEDDDEDPVDEFEDDSEDGSDG